MSLVSDYHIVAIGLSAGGLEPLHQLLSYLVQPVNAVLIVVQHLHRDYQSMAAKFLQKHTTIPVLPVANGMQLKINHLYVMPENVMMTYHDGCLWLRRREPAEVVNRAIDILMHSMAPELGARAISIILSGLDGDGSLGSLHIGQTGGTTIAQLPNTAQYPSMPEGAIEKGQAQFVLTPKAIADLIISKTQTKFS